MLGKENGFKFKDQLRLAVLGGIQKLAPPFFPPDPYLAQPVVTWPPLFGLVHDVRVPRRTKPQSFPRPSGAANIDILLTMLDRTRDIPGDAAECGVYRGATLVPMATHLKQIAPLKHLFGFDSFEGFDESVLIDIAMNAPGEVRKRVGAWNETSYFQVAEKLLRFRADNVTLVPGYFHDSLPKYADRRFSYVHVDVGIYQANKECLDFFYTRLNPGGILQANNYSDPPWPGCNKAIDEFLTDKPEKLEMIQIKGYQRFYFCKS